MGESKMKNMRILLAIAAASFVSSAQADTYTYVCRDHEGRYPLKLDDSKMSLSWKGVSYRIKAYEPGETCAKFGWRAEKNGVSFDFCTATQGYARIERKGKSIGIDCEQTKFKNKIIRRDTGGRVLN